jgi:hypothetical protein
MRELEQKYEWNGKLSPLRGKQQECVARLKRIFFEKCARYIANLEGMDYQTPDDDGNPTSYQMIPRQNSNFHVDLSEALMKVTRGYEEVYKDEKGNWKIRPRQLQMAQRSEI